MADTQDTAAPKHQISLELPEEIAEGIYANMAMVGHSSGEFILDFICMIPGMPKAKVKARIIITPEHIKRLIGVMTDNVEKYEAMFGPIRQPADPLRVPLHFGGTAGEA